MSEPSPRPAPFLILHKVRGTPAFDIAHRLDVGTEEDPSPWWIVTTSGHRAYPVWYQPLDAFVWYTGEIIVSVSHAISDNGFKNVELTIPDDWPDHYTTSRSPSTFSGAGRALLAKLGLGSGPKVRRI